MYFAQGVSRFGLHRRPIDTDLLAQRVSQNKSLMR